MHRRLSFPNPRPFEEHLSRHKKAVKKARAKIDFKEAHVKVLKQAEMDKTGERKRRRDRRARQRGEEARGQGVSG